jgi:hypothetical protein
MIAPVEVQDDGSFANDEDEAESQRIRAKYKTSGLYLNDGSTTPLWTVDWYSHSHHVLVASDGQHLIRRGYWTESLDDEALTFFADGKEIRSYKAGDLFYSSVLFPSMMEVFFWHEDTRLDEAKDRLTLTTTLKDRYDFDYTTGELIKSQSPVKAMIVGRCTFLWRNSSRVSQKEACQ